MLPCYTKGKKSLESRERRAVMERLSKRIPEFGGPWH